MYPTRAQKAGSETHLEHLMHIVDLLPQLCDALVTLVYECFVVGDEAVQLYSLFLFLLLQATS